MTCTYNGHCPKCHVPHEQLGEYNHFPPQDFNETIDIYALANGNGHTFHATCFEADIKPMYHPF